CDTPGGAYGVTVNDNYAYLADRFEGLQIIDVTNPSEPVIVGNYQTPEHAQVDQVLIVDNYAYLAEFDEGLEIVDVSDPENPIGLSHLDSFHFTKDLVVIDGFAYLACGGQGLQIVDVQDPNNPAVIDSFTLGIQHARRIFSRDGYILLADNRNLVVFQIDRPGEVSLVGSYVSPDYILGGGVSNDDIVLANYSRGVRVIDASNLQFVDHYQTVYEVWDIQVKGRISYVATRGDFLILELDPTGIVDDNLTPYEFFLSQNYPNPFNASTTIRYKLQQAARVKLDIYDILGKKMETLVNEYQETGEYSFLWNAQKHDSGIYFYRLATGEIIETKKMVLLK
ncbi:MAG: T9SS type A sorting domain-containing protein, partial [bacterium]|nr:T9SS type A sorting domain-containing protein [bacterium]